MDAYETKRIENVTLALSTAPVDYQHLHETQALTQTEVMALEGIAVNLIRLVSYLESRNDMHSHKAAVKESNATVAKVRRALGYTYPKADISY